MKLESTLESSQAALDTRSLLSPLRERPTAVESPELSEARLQRIVPRLEVFTQEVLTAKRRRRTWARGSWLLAALATGVGAGMLYGRFEDENAKDSVTVAGDLVQVGDRDERTLLSGNLKAAPLGRVETGELGASISTVEGLDLELGPQTSARVGQLGGRAERQRVHLEAGSIRCHVPKLGDAREFSVVTPDALVIVHGTRFSVEVHPDEAGVAHTCVRVSEGRVSVQGHQGAPVFLERGGQFGCGGDSAHVLDAIATEGVSDLVVGDELPTASESAPGSESRKGAGTVGKPGVRETQTTGTLSEETRLLQAAVRAEQKGDVDVAQSYLDRLLATYPRSPLAQDARLMRQRLSARQE